MSTGLGIAVAGLLIAGAIVLNGYMERRPYNRAFELCMDKLRDTDSQSSQAQMESVCLRVAARAT